MDDKELRFYIFDHLMEKIGTFAYSSAEAIENIESHYRVGFSNIEDFMKVLSKEKTDKYIKC